MRSTPILPRGGSILVVTFVIAIVAVGVVLVLQLRFLLIVAVIAAAIFGRSRGSEGALLDGQM